MSRTESNAAWKKKKKKKKKKIETTRGVLFGKKKKTETDRLFFASPRSPVGPPAIHRCCFVSSMRVYHTIPHPAEGTSASTNAKPPTVMTARNRKTEKVPLLEARSSQRSMNSATT